MFLPEVFETPWYESMDSFLLYENPEIVEAICFKVRNIL